MSNPAISVVVPVYNVEKFVGECLDSILGQTFTDFEIICVNDGATDSSPLILDKYAQKDNRIKVISRENGGLSAARNTGTKHCNGKYIYYVDSDDYIAADALEIMHNAAEMDNLDILYIANDFAFDSDQLRNEALIKYYKRKNNPESVVSGEEMLDNFINKSKLLAPVWLMFINREFMMNTGMVFKEGILHEDELFTTLITAEAKRTKCITDKLYTQRIRGNSITTTKISHKNFIGYFITYAELVAKAMQMPHYTELTKKLIIKYAGDIYQTSKRTYESVSSQERELAYLNMPQEYKVLMQPLIEQYKTESSLAYKIGKSINNIFKKINILKI